MNAARVFFTSFACLRFADSIAICSRDACECRKTRTSLVREQGLRRAAQAALIKSENHREAEVKQTLDVWFASVEVGEKSGTALHGEDTLYLRENK